METEAINYTDFTLVATYEVCLVVFSIAIGIVASYTALALARRVTLTQGFVSNLWLTGGAIALGIGIWSMHFIAMLAYHLPIPISYDPRIVFVSLVVAIVAAFVALFVVSRHQMGWLQFLGGGIFLGLGVAAMHYIGMAAMCQQAIAQYDLKLVILSVVVAIAVSLTALWLAFHLRTETSVAGNMGKTGSAILMAIAIAGMHYTAMAAVSFKPYPQSVIGLQFPLENNLLAVAIGIANLIILILTLLSSFFEQQRLAETARRVEALNQTEERFRNLVETTNDWFWEVDQNGVYTYASPRIRDILGYEPTELLGKTRFDFMPKEEAKRVAKIFAALTATKQPFTYLENTNQHQDGHLVVLETSGIPLLHLDGSLRGYIGVDRDVTERKRVEAAVRNSEAELRALFSAMNNLIFVFDAQGRYLKVAPTNPTLLYNPAAERIGKTLYEVLPQPQADTLLNHIQRALNTRETVTLEYSLPIGETEFWFSGAISPMSADQVIFVAHDISDRKRAEAALRKSQESYRVFIEQSSEGIWRFDFEIPLAINCSEDEQIQHFYQYSYLAECNDAMAKMHGFDCAADIVGLRLEDFMISSAPHNIEYLRNFIRSGHQLQDAELHQLDKQGNLKYFQNNLFGIVEVGYLVVVWGSQRDITERKRVEQALCQSEAKNRALLNAIPDLMLRISRDGSYLDCKQAKDFNTLMPDSELIGKSEYEVLPPALAHQRMQYVEQALQTGDIQIFEYELLLNGKIHHEEARIVVSGEDEVLAIIRNITERKQAEAALRKSEQKLSLHIQQTPLAVIEWNTNFEITEWNPAAEAIFGYSRAEAVGKYGNELLIPESAKQHVNKIRDELLTLKGGSRSTNENVTKDARTIICEWYNTPLVDQSGCVIGVASLAQDISDRKQAEVELQKAKENAEAANRAKSEFLANMSHEIRTPMNGVIGMTGLLLDTKLTPQQRDFVETIRSCGDALLTIINDILDFSKIESGKLDLEEQPLELQACIEEVLDLLAPKAIEKNLEIIYLIEPQTPNVIVGDITRLRQILVNLLSNAVKFTEIGEVVVSVTAKKSQKSMQRRGISRLYKSQKLEENTSPDSWLLTSGSFYEIQFAVKDTGIGILQEKMDRLFQSFSQVDASITRQYGGTGLGLAISKRLSNMMGGRMWVESRGAVAGNPPPRWTSANLNLPVEDKGSTFYFTIVAKSAPEAVQVDYHQHTQRQLTGKRLLIVDDNATNRKILALQGQSWGMLTRTVASGVEALDLIHQGEPFDIAILDVQMPMMDGLTLAAAIRKQPKYQNLPLVMLTSLGKQELAVSAANFNFAAYLNKPIKQSQLYNVLLEILNEQPLKVVPSTVSPQINRQLATAHPLKILLAEDNIVNQKVAIHILQQMGYRPDVAGNGLEVLAALQRQFYDVVLMDVQMPEMDGLTATRCICQKWSQARPRIIAMTANAMQGDREICMNAGMDDYLSKPLRVEELIQVLSKCQPQQDGQGEQKKQIQNSIDAKVLQALREIAGEDASKFMAAIIDAFLEDAPKLLHEIESAIAQADAITLQRATHTLKSSSATLGAMTLSQFCKQLEAMSHAGTLEAGRQTVSQIEAEYEKVKVALQIKRQECNS